MVEYLTTDDWYWSNLFGNTAASTTLTNSYDHSIDPLEYKYSFFKFDTSDIPDGATVTACEFHFYGHSYTASKGITFLYNTAITNNWVNEENFVTADSNRTYSGAGWKTVPLASDALQYVNKTGFTWIRLSVPDPGVGKYRTMASRAIEYAGDYDAHLVVTYSTYSGQVIQIINS